MEHHIKVKCDCLIYHLQNKNIHDDAQMSTKGRGKTKREGWGYENSSGKAAKRYGKKKYKNTCNKQKKKKNGNAGT
jgi:hypothetical protein